MTTSLECDHTRGLGRRRSSAVTICSSCRDFLCSTCGVTIAWHVGLGVTNPVVRWRYCAKIECIEAEAVYHAIPPETMTRHRGALRAKRVLAHLQDRGVEPRPQFRIQTTTSADSRRILPMPSNEVTAPSDGNGSSKAGASLLSRPERISLTPFAFTLDPGEACWCNRGKDCDGGHEIGPVTVENLCGLCGETFEISETDPHWSTGRGPFCPPKGPRYEPDLAGRGPTDRRGG